MAVGIPAHIGLYLCTHDVSDTCHVVGGNAVHDPQRDINGNNDKDALHRKCGEIVKSLIGDVTHDDGEHQFAQRCQAGAYQVQYQCFFVRLKIWGEPVKKFFSRVLSVFHFFLPFCRKSGIFIRQESSFPVEKYIYAHARGGQSLPDGARAGARVCAGAHTFPQKGVFPVLHV